MKQHILLCFRMDIAQRMLSERFLAVPGPEVKQAFRKFFGPIKYFSYFQVPVFINRQMVMGTCLNGRPFCARGLVRKTNFELYRNNQFLYVDCKMLRCYVFLEAGMDKGNQEFIP